MTSADEATIALKQIKDAGSGKSVLDLGWIELLDFRPPKAVIRMKLPGFAQNQRDRLAGEIKNSLEALDGIEQVQIEIANSQNTSPIGQAGHGQPAPMQDIPGVKKVIAVSSGKGGVGKSTVSVNLACAFSSHGLRVGLLDADIYGPNIPTMLGVSDKTPEVQGEGADQKIIPIKAHGVSMVSMGLLIDDNQPVVWRGPMLNGIIRQFLYQTCWGELDVLVVDLPPGTGDAQLSLAQSVPMAGVLIVTTPQKVSLQDAGRGLAMFKQMNVPVLGVVENMTAFVPPEDQTKSYALFGSGGGKLLSSQNSVPLLAEIPIEMPVQEGGDQGQPILKSQPLSRSSKVFKQLAKSVLEELEKRTSDVF